VDLQRIVNAGDQTRASDLRPRTRAKEAELVTLGRLGEAVRDRLIASHHPRYWAATSAAGSTVADGLPRGFRLEGPEVAV